MLAGRYAPGIRGRGLREAGMQTHGCRGVAKPCRITLARAQACFLAGIDKGPGGTPHTHDDVHRSVTGRTADHKRLWGAARWRLALAGVDLRDHQADGRERDSTAGMKKAEMPDFLKAIGQDMLEKAAEKFHDVEMGGAWTCTAYFPVGEGDRAIRKRDKAAVGDGDLENIRGEGGESGVALVIGLTMDVPGDGPDLWGDVL